MHARRPRARLFAIAALAAVTSIALVRAHPPLHGSPASWTGDEVAWRGAWLVALACSTWLATLSMICVVALRTRHRGAARVAAALAPRFLRRLVEVALVGSCVVAPALPAAATTPADRPVVVTVDEPVVRAAAAPVTHAQHSSPRPPPPPPPARVAHHSHVVGRGDNLWQIARAELAARGNARADDATIARYWRQVIAANRATLRSGNPNLIFPGEIVALPEPA